MKKVKVSCFHIRVKVPKGVTKPQMKRYIIYSIQSSVGALSPEDPLFYLDRESVRLILNHTVTEITLSKRKK